MKIQVFGRLTEIVGSSSLSIEGAADTDALAAILENQFPDISATRYVVAVNKKQVLENTKLQSDSTIVLMPPFSGG